MADTRYFTQEFNGTPAAKLTVVQPSGNVEYLPYGDDKTVYIGSSDSIISTTTEEIAADTGALFSKVRGTLLGSHYPIISIDKDKVYTYTGSDTTTTAGKATGTYFFISERDDATKYLNVTDTGCSFGESSGIEVISTTADAIESGTSRLFTAVNSAGGNCTIAVSRSVGKVANIEYFSLYSFVTNNGVPVYTFMSQDHWLRVSPSDDTLSSIVTTKEIVYIPWTGTQATDIATTYSKIITALTNQQWPVLYQTAPTSYTEVAYWRLVERGPGLVTFELVYNKSLYELVINEDGTATQTVTPVGGSSYTAKSPLHISDSGEIYMDPVGASPLSNITTPGLDVIRTHSPAASGGGYGNKWCSMEGHAFTVPNFFALESTDIFEYIVTQTQTATLVHRIAIFELDSSGYLHLCALSSNGASGDATAGTQAVGIEYIDSVYSTIKPDKIYYACHICDQSATLVAGLTASTFNLNPSSAKEPLGIAKTNLCSVNDDGSLPIDSIKTLAVNTFGMLAERHYVMLKHAE